MTNVWHRLSRLFGRRAVWLIATSALIAMGIAAAGADAAAQPGMHTQRHHAVTRAAARAQRRQLTVMMPPAKGPVSNAVVDLPGGEPTTLDYVKAGTPSSNNVVADMCDSLRRVTPSLGFAPSVASSYKYSHHHLVLTYTIRKGIRFWDGTGLTAADVAYSLNRNITPKDAPVNGYIYTYVKSIAATGKYTVVVRFKHPDELFNNEMAGAGGVIAEKAYMEKKGSSYGTPTGGVMCSGPLKFVKWSPGSDIVLAANDKYWVKSLRPKAKTVTVRFVANSSTLAQALESGSIDEATLVPEVDIPALSHPGPGHLYFGNGPFLDVMLANDTPVGNDANIRKALSLVLNRKAIVAAAYRSAATPAYDLLPEDMWGPSAHATFRAVTRSLGVATSPNIAKARALIKNDPLATKPIVMEAEAGDQTEIEALTLWQGEAAQIGLHVQIDEVQPLQFLNSFYESSARRGIDFLYDQTYTYVPDPMDYLLDNAMYGGSLIYIKYPGGAQATKYLLDARSEFNDTKRVMDIGSALRIMTREQLMIPMVSRFVTSYESRKFGGGIAGFGFFAYPDFALIGSA